MTKYFIRVDDKAVKRMLRQHPDQVRFATALALTKTAHDVRRHIVNTTWRRQVNVRTKGFMGRALRVNNADKRFRTAEVFVDRRRISPEGLDAIWRLIRGLPHYPYSSTHLAIPVGKGLLTRTGKLTKRGRGLLDKSNPATFVADLRGKGPAIYQRVGRGSKRLKLLFVLEPVSKTPRKFTFFQSAERQALKVWPRHARAAVEKAIATANR